MTENLAKALQITLIGMGLVFVGILLLWFLMVFMVRIAAPKKYVGRNLEDSEKADSADDVLKRKAVAAAVVTAIALQNAIPSTSSHAAREALTPWQSALRSRQLQLGNQFNRKK